MGMGNNTAARERTTQARPLRAARQQRRSTDHTRAPQRVPGARAPWCTVRGVPFTVYCVPRTVYCVLRAVYGVLRTVYCVLCTVCCVLCSVLCTVSRVPCTASCVPRTRNYCVYGVRCTVDGVRRIAYCNTQ